MQDAVIEKDDTGDNAEGRYCPHYAIAEKSLHSYILSQPLPIPRG
jgi:hypothetical protein